jgi:hypothetical protein
VIRPIETSEALEATQQTQPNRAVGPATAAGKTFATVLAREKKSTTAAAETESAEAAKRPTHRKHPIDAPEHEVWRPVRGNDDYAKIVEGPRAGYYINLSRGDRRGEIFKVEERDGKRVHVYGSGENEKVIEALKDSGRVPGNARGASAARVPKGEQWAPVDGVSNYADILNGKRNGYYVNTSGGVRDGMAFQIVKDGDRVLHVYGKGKNRQVIEVSSGKADGKKADESAPATDDTRTNGVNADGSAGAESTGGTRADD